MRYFELVHIRQNKTEMIIKITPDAEKIKKITDKFQWTGVWLTPERKLLRHNRGELVIRTKYKQPRIAGYKIISVAGKPWYECEVKYHDDLQSICLNASIIVGYSKEGKVIWSSSSFTELADKLVGKELAYQCQRYQDKFMEEHNLQKGIG